MNGDSYQCLPYVTNYAQYGRDVAMCKETLDQKIKIIKNKAGSIKKSNKNNKSITMIPLELRVGKMTFLYLRKIINL